MAELNFDAAQVAPEFGIDTIPPDWYNAMIDQSEIKPTKDGTGAYLQLRFSIIDGQYANRKVFTNLNIRNANPVTQEIAYRQLSAIAHAVGVMQVQDSSQLHGVPMRIKVKIRKDKDGQYEDRNEISSVKSIQSTMPPGYVAQANPAAAAPVQPWSQPAAPAGWVPQAAPAAAPMPAPAPAPTMPAAAAPAAPAATPAALAPGQPPVSAPRRRGRPPKNPPAAAPVATAPVATAPAPVAAPAPLTPAQAGVGYQPPWAAAPAVQGGTVTPAAAPAPVAAAQTAVPPWMQGEEDGE